MSEKWTFRSFFNYASDKFKSLDPSKILTVLSLVADGAKGCYNLYWGDELNPNHKFLELQVINATSNHEFTWEDEDTHTYFDCGCFFSHPDHPVILPNSCTVAKFSAQKVSIHGATGAIAFKMDETNKYLVIGFKSSTSPTPQHVVTIITLKEEEKPKEGSQQQKPKEGPQKEDPKEGAQKEDPKEGAQKEDPKEGPQKEDPKEGAQKEDPKEGPQKEDPKEGAQKEDPKEGAQKKDPKEGPQKENPDKGPQKENPKEGTQLEKLKEELKRIYETICDGKAKKFCAEGCKIDLLLAESSDCDRKIKVTITEESKPTKEAYKEIDRHRSKDHDCFGDE